MWNFLLQAAPAEPLMLPDSLQKAHFEQTVQKLVNLDLNELLQTLLSESMWIALKIVVALVIYYIGRWMLRRLLRLVDRMMERRSADLSLRAFTQSTVRVVFMLLLLLIVVSTLGVNVTSLIAVASAATLAIGMALSGTAQNFAGGVMILVMKPYRIGDYISAQGQSGTVQDIKLFSTVITTPDNQTIYIPNNAIATAIIDNYSAAPERRVDWSVSLAGGDDLDLARRTILAMLSEDSRVLSTPEPVVLVASLNVGSVTLSVRAWAKNDDYWDLFFLYNERFYKELPAAGLSFPTPRMVVNVDQKK